MLFINFYYKYIHNLCKLAFLALYMKKNYIILECIESKKKGKFSSRYISSENKKRQLQGRIERKKYNPFLKKHTIHREIKN